MKDALVIAIIALSAGALIGLAIALARAFGVGGYKEGGFTPIPMLPVKPNVDNIAYMLRRLAENSDDFKSVIIVGITDVNSRPVVEQYGQELGRLTEVGALHEAIRRITR